MTHERSPSIGSELFRGLFVFALGCGIQAAIAPTVTVSCPARTAAAPDCTLRWLVAFDVLPVRRTALPALQSIDQVEPLRRGSSGSQRRAAAAFTVYLRSAAGRTRAILLGDQEELRTFRAPIATYLGDPHAPALEVTMRANAEPWGWFASVIIGVGLLYGAIVLARVVRRFRASSSSVASSPGP